MSGLHDDRTAEDHAVNDDGWDVALFLATLAAVIAAMGAAFWWLWRTLR